MSSLLSGAKAKVTGMGREISFIAYEKHRINLANRLLSNKHIINEVLSIYHSDWSDLETHKSYFLLRASMNFKYTVAAK